MPRNPDTTHCLLALNSFVSKGALRGYQRDILTTGTFICPCPQTANMRNPDAHFVLPGKAIFYFFMGPTPFVAIAASLKDGFPLVALTTLDDTHWLGKVRDTDLVATAKQLFRDPSLLAVDPTLPTRVPIGDVNFAHYIWNEFPALCTAISLTKRFEVDRRFDPLKLTQRLTQNARVTTHDMPHPSAGKGWSTYPTTFLGSITNGTNHMDTAKDLLELPPHTGSMPNIWLTIRDRGRTLANQEAFLKEFIAQQQAENPKTNFLLDGFSTPMDYDRPIYDMLRPKFAARISGAQFIASQIISSQRNAHITDLSGEPLDIALTQIAKCHFYLSHTGTMQHKPAWFYPIRGLQHGNHASITPAALRWAAHMIDGSLPPLGMPLELIEDTCINTQPVQNDRNMDYRITDIPAAVTHVLQQMVQTRPMMPAA